MARRSSSRRWLKEHARDAWVRRARDQGYRSRAAYKLLEIQASDRFLDPGRTVLDLGAAPGGWSQVVAECLDGRGRVLALDILSMQPIPGVEFLRGDFTDPNTRHALNARLGSRGADVVISDMAPNISGIPHADQTRCMELAEAVLQMARQCLPVGGDLLVKVFQGKGYEAFLGTVRKEFAKVRVRKPLSSRKRSTEVYLLGRGLCTADGFPNEQTREVNS